MNGTKLTTMPISRHQRTLLVIVVTTFVSLSVNSQNSGPNQAGSLFTSDQARQFLNYHNEKRAEVGVGPLEWSSELAREAQAWADHLAENGKLVHRPRIGPNATRHGENLAAGYGNGFGIMSGAATWYNEKNQYRAGSPVTNFSYKKTGHYTQMVWRDTTRLGAGYAIGLRGNLKGWLIVVCNYDPPGNFIGKSPY